MDNEATAICPHAEKLETCPHCDAMDNMKDMGLMMTMGPNLRLRFCEHDGMPLFEIAWLSSETGEMYLRVSDWFRNESDKPELDEPELLVMVGLTSLLLARKKFDLMKE